MTNDKVNQVLQGYLDGALCFGSQRFDAVEQTFSLTSKDDLRALQHCAALAQLAIDMPAERLEKKFRWLGFIQGVLWATGRASIEELKRDNMPDEEKTPVRLKDLPAGSE